MRCVARKSENAKGSYLGDHDHGSPELGTVTYSGTPH